MGVNLRDLFPQHPIEPAWYTGKRIAVDAPNIAFRYLTSFRGPSGDVLRNASGRPIGHLLGFLNLVRHLRERGAEPIVVWDGTVHPRKRATVEGRIQRRLEAALGAQDALEAGDHDAHKRLLRATTMLDRSMVEDATALLEALGVPVLRADHDAERFAAGLCLAGHADAVATEDYDALVAGAPMVLRKAGGPNAFQHRLSDAPITASQLRQVAILCGTDWHPGVDGFGAKTALKALGQYPNLGDLVRDAAAGGTGRWHQMVRDAGLTPAEFDELEDFIAAVPKPEPVLSPKPDPGRAMELASEWGLGKARVVACYC